VGQNGGVTAQSSNPHAALSSFARAITPSRRRRASSGWPSLARSKLCRIARTPVSQVFLASSATPPPSARTCKMGFYRMDDANRRHSEPGFCRRTSVIVDWLAEQQAPKSIPAIKSFR
jgi:hypothetical protein